MGLVWIAAELTAGILALCLLVLALPAVVVLMIDPTDLGVRLAGGAAAIGGTAAITLGRAALLLPQELLRGAARP